MPEGWVHQTAARNVQSLVVTLAQESRELVPCPVTEVRNGPKEFRSSWLDATAMRCHQQTPPDASVSKRNAEIPARNIAPVEYLLVAAQLSQETH